MIGEPKGLPEAVRDKTPCDAVWDLLSLYADGEAGPKERDTVERHVACCESCALDLQFLRETVTVLAKTPLVSPPPHLKNAILAATIYRPSWQQRIREALAPAIPASRVRTAGALAAISLVGVLMAKTVQHQAPGSRRDPGVSHIQMADAAHAGNSKNVPEALDGAAPSGTVNLLARGGASSLQKKPGVQNNEQDSRLGLVVEDVKNSIDGRITSHVQQPNHVPAQIAVSTHRPSFRGSKLTLPDTAPTGTGLAPKAVDDPTLTEPEGMRETINVAGPSVPPTIGPDPGGEPKDPGPSGGSSAPPIHTRYTLTASAPSGGADALVSFADLRSALRKNGESMRTVAFDVDGNERRTGLDVLKSRF